MSYWEYVSWYYSSSKWIKNIVKKNADNQPNKQVPVLFYANSTHVRIYNYYILLRPVKPTVPENILKNFSSWSCVYLQNFSIFFLEPKDKTIAQSNDRCAQWNILKIEEVIDGCVLNIQNLTTKVWYFSIWKLFRIISWRNIKTQHFFLFKNKIK